MLYEAEGTTPLQNFAIMYSDSYFVTEEQAYNATQDAVWRLLHQYNIEDNNMNDLEHDALAQVLYVYSERGGLLNYEPSLKDVHLTGDLKFTYNSRDVLYYRDESIKDEMKIMDLMTNSLDDLSFIKRKEIFSYQNEYRYLIVDELEERKNIRFEIGDLKDLATIMSKSEFLKTL